MLDSVMDMSADEISQVGGGKLDGMGWFSLAADAIQIGEFLADNRAAIADFFVSQGTLYYELNDGYPPLE